MKREDFISREEMVALLERLEAQSLKKGDGQILMEVIRKTLRIEQWVKEGKIPTGRKLRQFLAIPRPKEPGEKGSDE